MKVTTDQSSRPASSKQKEIIERFIRVDHAGEYGAKRIYEGQLAILGNTEEGDTIRHMKEQEEVHLSTFENLLVERKIRPTALYPIWQIAGFALGVGTALMGPKAAMACTVAVEEVIDEHYAAQSETLDESEKGLKQTIDKFRAEELEHRDTAIEHGGQEALGYPVMRRAIRIGSKAAIWLSERF